MNYERADSQYVVEYRALYHCIKTGDICESEEYDGNKWRQINKLINELDEGLHSETIQTGVKGSEYLVRLDSIERVEHYYNLVHGEKDFAGDRDEEVIWSRNAEYPEGIQ